MIVILTIILIISTLFFLGWLIGYPIYRKVIGEPVFVGSNYAVVLCLIALTINICTFLIQVLRLL